jgi:hypothetical protein
MFSETFWSWITLGGHDVSQYTADSKKVALQNRSLRTRVRYRKVGTKLTTQDCGIKVVISLLYQSCWATSTYIHPVHYN